MQDGYDFILLLVITIMFVLALTDLITTTLVYF